MNEVPTWEKDIQPMVSPFAGCMKNITGGNLDLANCQSVHDWAQEIYIRMSAAEDDSDKMPPGAIWSPDVRKQNSAIFKAWLDAGAQCPAPGAE